MSVPRVQVFGHRGAAALAPENTLAAFQEAIAAGADGVEFDVQFSADGVPVVIHDERLVRTTGAGGEVGERALADLRKLDAGSWFDPRFAGERIPTLAEVLELLRPTSLIVQAELKTGRRPYPGLAAAVVALVREQGLAGRTVLSSFNHHSLLEARAADPSIPCAALVADHLLEPWDYVARHGFAGFHPPHGAVSAEVVAGCHARAIPVRTWTVNRREDADRLFALGVDGLIGDDPRALLEWRAAWRIAHGEGA